MRSKLPFIVLVCIVVYFAHGFFSDKAPVQYDSGFTFTEMQDSAYKQDICRRAIQESKAGIYLFGNCIIIQGDSPWTAQVADCKRWDAVISYYTQ